MTPTAGSPSTGTDPEWCVRFYCTANGTTSGAHRSTPIVVSEPPLGMETVVEVRGVPVLLPAQIAHHLGRVLTSLGKAGEPE